KAAKKPGHVFAQVEEWLSHQTFALEKEALGFDITGHPLEKYEREIMRMTLETIAGLEEKAAHGDVKISGDVPALNLDNRRKGDRYGSFNLEDKRGFVEGVAWPDVYRKSVEFLNSDDPIYVKGRMEVGEERMQLFANETTSLAQEVAKSRLNGGANGKTNGHGDPSTRAQVIATGRSVKIPPRLQGDALAEATEPKMDQADAWGLPQGLKRVHLYVRESEVSSDELMQLRETLLEHRGPCAVVLHLFDSGKDETVI